MAEVKVSQPHALSPADARDRLGGFSEMLGKYGVALKWAGDRATIKGTGVSGDVVVGPSAVDVTVKLGMLARAAGVDPKRLQASIAKRLRAAFEEGAG